MSFVLWNEIARRTRFEGIVATMSAAMLHSVGRAEIQIGFVGFFFDGFLDDGRYLETRAQKCSRNSVRHMHDAIVLRRGRARRYARGGAVDGSAFARKSLLLLQQGLQVLFVENKAVDERDDNPSDYRFQDSRHAYIYSREK